MQINKISPERKLETKKRLNGAIYLVLLALAYVLCALLADPRHKTDPNSFDGFSFYLPLHWGNSIFAILMLGFKIALTFFISIELDNCFIKSNHNKKVIASLFLCLFIPMFCADLLILYFVYFGENQDRLRITPIIYFALFFLTLIILIPTYFLSKLSKNSNKFNNISLPLISFAIIIALNGIIYLCIIRGILTFLILVLIPVCCDVGGYIFGVLFGKHKLAPKISPKKTWEGLFGSFLFTILIIIPIIFLFGVGNGSHYQLQGNFLGNQWNQSVTRNAKLNPGNLVWYFIVILVVFIVALSSVIGDLLFSVFKRKNGIKDYSNIIVGHGGILDRIDSWILPIFMFFTITITISGVSTLMDHDGWWNTNRIFNFIYEG